MELKCPYNNSWKSQNQRVYISLGTAYFQGVHGVSEFYDETNKRSPTANKMQREIQKKAL